MTEHTARVTEIERLKARVAELEKALDDIGNYVYTVKTMGDPRPVIWSTFDLIQERVGNTLPEDYGA